jgi:hypothetical protein
MSRKTPFPRKLKSAVRNTENYETYEYETDEKDVDWHCFELKNFFPTCV